MDSTSAKSYKTQSNSAEPKQKGESSKKNSEKDGHSVTKSKSLQSSVNPNRHQQQQQQQHQNIASYIAGAGTWIEGSLCHKLEQFAVASLAAHVTQKENFSFSINGTAHNHIEQSQFTEPQTSQTYSKLQHWLDTPLQQQPYNNLGSVFVFGEGHNENENIGDEEMNEDC